MPMGDAGKLERELRAIAEAMRRGDRAGASEVAERALAAGLVHPHLLTICAYRRMEAGQTEAALALASQAAELDPRNIDALAAKANCLARLERAREAMEIFDAAIALAPGDAGLRYAAAIALEQLREFKRAAQAFESAFALDPGNVEAAARLAFLSSTRGDMRMAREAGMKALARNPHQVMASFAVALADLEAEKFEDAERRVREVLDLPGASTVVRAMAQSILGDVLSAMGRYDAAYACYASSGAALRNLYAPPPKAGETALARARRIAAYIEREPASKWRSAAGNSPVRSHAFLVSFPRSGTTLLSNILDAHPHIRALDERRTLATSLDLAASDEGLDRFTAMGESELDTYREAYWSRARSNGFDGTKSVLVDKMPLNSVNLCLVARLFPQAKIIFALRDPRDVVFSCFRRRFEMSRQHYELLTLESTATYYDAVMGLSEIGREKLGLAFFDVRNEDLVSAFSEWTNALCAFLGVEPDAALEGFAARARNRDIATPGASQIGRGLSSNSFDRWKPFAAHMAAVMPLLDPWVRRFGYGDA